MIILETSLHECGGFKGSDEDMAYARAVESIYIYIYIYMYMYMYMWVRSLHDGMCSFVGSPLSIVGPSHIWGQFWTPLSEMDLVV